MQQTLKLGLNKGFYGEVFFVKAMHQLGPNIWLARYTKDKRGRSKSWRVGLLGWRMMSANTTYSNQQHRSGFYPYGEARNIADAYTLIDLYPRQHQIYDAGVDMVMRLSGDVRLTTGATALVNAALVMLPKEMFDEHDDSLRLYRYGDFISEDGEA